ncbi:hypothetical protein GCM10020221_27360 [Streptomyces thioluteus]|uniref:YtkA-like domain-containing protein n=1 Tax=Streptomyces thioluteus TaxID=66431 RepID=A0ABP6JFH8_STRTU
MFSRRWTARLAEGIRPSGPRKETPAARTADSPERAAQLARQRAAVAKAAGKRRRDADPARSALRRSVLAEAAVAVVLLAVTTVLTTTQPGRAEAEQERAGRTDGGSTAPATTGRTDVTITYDTGGTNGRGTARIALDPGRPGANTVDVALTDPAGKPADVPEATVSFTEKEKGIGPLRVPLERVSAGRLRASGFQLPMAGRWQLTLTVRTSEIDQVTEIENVEIND